MKTLRDLVRAIFTLADAIFALAAALDPKINYELISSEERLQKIMEKIRSEEEKVGEEFAVEEENGEFPLPEGKVVEFSADVEGQEQAKIEMLDYLRDRGVVVTENYRQESPENLAKELGIPFEALRISE